MTAHVNLLGSPLGAGLDLTLRGGSPGSAASPPSADFAAALASACIGSAAAPAILDVPVLAAWLWPMEMDLSSGGLSGGDRTVSNGDGAFESEDGEFVAAGDKAAAEDLVTVAPIAIPIVPPVPVSDVVVRAALMGSGELFAGAAVDPEIAATPSPHPESHTGKAEASPVDVGLPRVSVSTEGREGDTATQPPASGVAPRFDASRPPMEGRPVAAAVDAAPERLEVPLGAPSRAAAAETNAFATHARGHDEPMDADRVSQDRGDVDTALATAATRMNADTGGASRQAPDNRDDHRSAPSTIHVASVGETRFTAPLHEAAPVTAATPFSAAEESQLEQQIVQAMRYQMRNGAGDATVRLQPEHLGEVTISLRVDGSVVSATVQAEVLAVRQWMESHEASLRDGLARQGLDLEEFVVRRDGRHEEQAAPREREQRRGRPQHRDSEAPVRFEVTV